MLECARQTVSLQIVPPSSVDLRAEDAAKEPAFCPRTVSAPRLVPVRVEDALLLVVPTGEAEAPDSWPPPKSVSLLLLLLPGTQESKRRNTSK